MSRRRLLEGACAMLAVWPGPAALRAQTVQGRVVDEGSRRPLEAAEVLLLHPDGAVAASALSDSAGRYLLRPPEPGECILGVALIGYERLRTPLLALDERRTLSADFELSPDPIELEGLRVEAEATQRIREGLRTLGVDSELLGRRFVDRAAIERRPEARDFGRVLQWQGIPGVSITRSDDVPGVPAGSPVCVGFLSRPRSGCALMALNGSLVTPETAALIPAESLGAIVSSPPTRPRSSTARSEAAAPCCSSRATSFATDPRYRRILNSPSGIPGLGSIGSSP